MNMADTKSRQAARLVFYGLALFLCAGTARWPAGWAFLAANVATLPLAAVYLADDYRSFQPHGHRDKRLYLLYRYLMWIYSVPLSLVQLGLAGREAMHGNPEISLWLRVSGWALYSLGILIINWSVNSYPSWSLEQHYQGDSNMSIASRRRYPLRYPKEFAEHGPYRWVRHPEYIGILATLVGTPLILGSRHALTVTAFGVALLFARTAIEDRLLRHEWPGYASYCLRTRYRFLPGLW